MPSPVNPWIVPILDFLEVLILLVAVYLTIAQFRRNRASAYIERFNGKDMLETRVAIDEWYQTHPSHLERLAALEQDTALTNKLRQFCNLFQELGTSYEFGLAHRPTTRVFFDSLVVRYWERLRFWIYHYRAESDPTLYARFEGLYEKIKGHSDKNNGETTYLVGYGSLMDPESLSKATEEPVIPDALVPVRISGYKRTWSLGEMVRLQKGNREVLAAFLDIEPAADSTIDAVMLPVSDSDLERVAHREKNYLQVTITNSVQLLNGGSLHAGANVVTFRGLEEFRLNSEKHKAILLTDYLDRVSAAALSISVRLEQDILASVADAPWERVPGEYTFLDPNQAELV